MAAHGSPKTERSETPQPWPIPASCANVAVASRLGGSRRRAPKEIDMSRLHRFCVGATAFAMLSAAAAPLASAALPASNPFAQPSSLPYQAPRFDMIKDSDYQPALRGGHEGAARRDRGDRRQSRAAHFDNTIVAMEKSGRDAGPVSATPSSAWCRPTPTHAGRRYRPRRRPSSPRIRTRSISIPSSSRG